MWPFDLTERRRLEAAERAAECDAFLTAITALKDVAIAQSHSIDAIPRALETIYSSFQTGASPESRTVTEEDMWRKEQDGFAKANLPIDTGLPLNWFIQEEANRF